MNQIIRVLAEKAGEEVITQDLGPSMVTESESGTRLTVPAVFIERFSDLLIQEVINVLNNDSRVRISGAPRIVKNYFKSVSSAPKKENEDWG